MVNTSPADTGFQKYIIIIDYDDVIIAIAPQVLEHYNRIYGTHAVLEDYMNYSDLAAWGTSDQASVVERVEDYLENKNYQHFPPMENCIETINKLAERYELHVVTGRSSRLRPSTTAAINYFFPNIFSSVVYTNFFNSNIRSKADICRKLQANLLIDDHLPHVIGVAEQGIDVLLFGDYPWNQAENLPPHIRRVTSWSEIADLLLKKTLQHDDQLLTNVA